MLKTTWCKMRAGLYRKDIFLLPENGTPVRFEVEYDPECRIWRCYRNDKQFDAGQTLAEAKGYCREEF